MRQHVAARDSVRLQPAVDGGVAVARYELAPLAFVDQPELQQVLLPLVGIQMAACLERALACNG